MSNTAIAKFKASTCFKQLNAIAENYELADEGSAKNMQVVERICRIATDGGYMYVQPFHCKQVGCMPSNRGGEGMLWTRAHTRVEKIDKAGFVLKVLEANALAVEDNPITLEFAKYTTALCSTSEKYANYISEEIKIGCLGATHATHGMSCVYDQVPCDMPSISKNGRMSQEKIFENDDDFRAAVMTNVRYKVLRWEVNAVLPKLSSIIMSGLNTEQHIGEGLKYY
jgi:hypothetical protein